jgi:hypothetical protein
LFSRAQPRRSAHSQRDLRRGAVWVPLEAIQLHLNLERRAFDVHVDMLTLLVGPPERLSDADRAAIRTLKAFIVAIVNYVD